MAKSREKAPAGILPLADAIRKATKSAQFVVEGSLPVADPGLIVNGLGRVPLPLKRGAAKALIAACHVAPYGKGTKTLIDERVRKTFELDPSKFELRDEWNEAIVNATMSVAASLGLPAERLEAKLYKLLVYEKGGFFLPHRDSEKHDRMVASLIVALPNPFEGGGLVVRHGPAVRRFPFKDAASGTGACYAAFYADCTHEVERVTHGTRVALAYNLVLAPSRTTRPATKSTPSQALTESIETWTSRNPAKPLVFALDHHYTQRGLTLDLLKGADRTLANDVAAAANLAGAHVHLAQVTRHLVNSAFDGNDRYSRHNDDEEDEDDDSSPDDIEINDDDVIEDELNGDEWADLSGKKKSWGAVALDKSAIISSIPLEKWKPTSEEYEGYTGNAGNTLDRWYHRSALVVWHRDHHYQIITRGQATACIPEFLAKVKALSKSTEVNRTDVRRDVRQYAEALIANWTNRWSHSHPDPATSRLGEAFGDALLGLHDRDLIAAYLTVLSERDEVTSLTTFVAAACREFGEKSFEKELTRLITPGPDKYGHQRDLATRNVEWLAALCGDSSQDPDRRSFAVRLCQQAEGRFYELASRKPSWSKSHTASHAEAILPALLKAMAACGREEEFATLVQYVCESKHFTMEFAHVSSLKSLIPWSREQSVPAPSSLHSWYQAVQIQLEQATAERPTPPTDWARPADVECRCQFCTQLNGFLADPTSEVTRITASEEKRRYLIRQIENYKCDVTHTLARVGSPYSLVLTKTTGSHKRAVKQYEKDVLLLKELRALEKSRVKGISATRVRRNKANGPT